MYRYTTNTLKSFCERLNSLIYDFMVKRTLINNIKLLLNTHEQIKLRTTN